MYRLSRSRVINPTNYDDTGDLPSLGKKKKEMEERSIFWIRKARLACEHLGLVSEFHPIASDFDVT